MSRRLLLVCQGGSGTAASGSTGPFNTTLAPYGTGTDIQWPLAIYGSGTTFIGIIQGTGTANDISIAAWNNVARTYTTTLLHGALTEGASTVPDTHNQPAVTLRADGHIVTAYCAHLSKHMRIRVSSAAYSITGGFTSEYIITSSYDLTYPQLFVMSSGRIYMRARAILSSLAYIIQWYSDDGGLTWDIGTLVFTESTNNIYSAAATDGTYIDQFLIDQAPSYSGGWWMGTYRMNSAGTKYKSDGSTIAGSYPLHASDITEVFAPGSYRFPRGVVYDSGTPVLAWDSAQANPVLMGESRWSGSAWVPTTILSSTPVYSFATSTGGAKHGWDDANTYIAGKVIGSNPIDMGGTIEIFRYVRTAGVWDSGTQVTSAGQDPYAPFGVVSYAAELKFLWPVGDQAPSDGDPFDLGLQGVAA